MKAKELKEVLNSIPDDKTIFIEIHNRMGTLTKEIESYKIYIDAYGENKDKIACLYLTDKKDEQIK